MWGWNLDQKNEASSTRSLWWKLDASDQAALDPTPGYVVELYMFATITIST